jgi:thiol-disulfide isomerase/thioredoxin
MKKILLPFLVVVLFGCRNQAIVKTGLEGSKIPSFDLLLPDSIQHMNTGEIPAGKPTVFFYFSPYCPFCRAQTQLIVDHYKDLKDIHFIFLTPYAYSTVKPFYTRYNLGKYDNITVGVDEGRFFGDYFKTNKVPYIAFYDKERRLKQVDHGKISLDEIKGIALE